MPSLFGSLPKEEERVQQNLGHYAKLLAALGGTGEGWEFSGNCQDCGSASAYCVCGHVVRYLFELVKTGMPSVWVGSVCVETAPCLNKETIEAVKAKMAQIREAISAAKRKNAAAAKEAEVQAILEEIKPVYKSIYRLQKQAKEHKIFLARAVWSYRLLDPMWIVEPDRFGYKTKAGLVKRLAAELVSMKGVLAANEQDPPQARYSSSYSSRY